MFGSGFMLKRGFSFAPGYRLEQFLGRGQFGQVWRTSAPGGTAAAIKFIDLSGSEGAKEHEGIKRVKQIRHANLMPITAIWLLDVHGKAIEEAPEVTQETIHFKPLADPMATAGALPTEPSAHLSQPGIIEATGMVVMPQPEAAWLAVSMLLGGKSLQQLLRECVKNGLPGIPPKELLSYMDESAKGLDFLNISQHDLGEGIVAIQHCDVKPANIVLIGSSAVVCDFGLARILNRNQVTATSAAGTPAYMAPEAISGRPSKTSDQYSLAVTYYHLRTGTLPISDGTLWEVLDAHRTGKLDLSRVPEHEQAVLKRATALDWEKRFDSNLDFVESLREALRLEGHTRPAMMPANRHVSAPATVPTTAIDPSMTLMPGQDITVPIAPANPNVPPVASVVDAGSAAVSSGTASPTVANLDAGIGDTKRDAELQKTSAAMVHEHAVPPTVWWQQAKWITTGAIGVSVLLIGALVSSLRGEKEILPEPQPEDIGFGKDGIVEVKPDITPPPVRKTVTQWLSEAVTLLGKDDPAASASFDEAAKLEPALLTPQPMLLTGHINDVRVIGFSASGDQMVSIGDSPTPFVWPLGRIAAQGIGAIGTRVEHETCIGPTDMIETMSVDPAGEYFAMAEFNGGLTITRFASPSAPEKRLISADMGLASMAWHPKSSHIIAATFKPSIVFTTPTKSRDDALLRFDVAKPIKSIAMDPLGKWLLILGEDNIVSRVAWPEIEKITADSPASPALQAITSVGTRVSAMCAVRGLSENESALVAGGELGEVTLWSLGDEPKAIQQQPIHNCNIEVIAATAQGLAGPIATGDVNGGIGVWRADSQNPISKVQAHTASITSLDFSADGRWLVAASLDGDVTLWDLSTADLKMTRLSLEGIGTANCVKLESSGRWIAVGHAEGKIALWDLRQAKMLVGKVMETKKPTPSPKTKAATGNAV